jgi:hypothetical protein
VAIRLVLIVYLLMDMGEQCRVAGLLVGHAMDGPDVCRALGEHHGVAVWFHVPAVNLPGRRDAY